MSGIEKEEAEEDPLEMFQRAEALNEEASKLRTAAIRTLEKQLGLVPEVTRVREGDLEGIFLESLNYIDGRLWIQVRLDPPLPERWGKFRKFYGAWEKVG